MNDKKINIITESILSLQKELKDLFEEKEESNRLLRFLWYVEKLDMGCWAWRGGFNHHGYGQFHNGKTTVLAHRYSYELHNGKIEIGMTIDHVCSNTSCVNPTHLESVSSSENNRRAHERRRAR